MSDTNDEPVPAPNAPYSPDRRAEVLALCAAHDGQCSLVARQTGIPVHTVARWWQESSRERRQAVTGRPNLHPSAELVQEKYIGLVNSFDELARRALDSLNKRDFDKEENIQRVVVTAAVAVDKAQVLRAATGQPADRTRLTSLNIDALTPAELVTLSEILAKCSPGGAVPVNLLRQAALPEPGGPEPPDDHAAGAPPSE
jgi:transposase-like protein